MIYVCIYIISFCDETCGNLENVIIFSIFVYVQDGLGDLVHGSWLIIDKCLFVGLIDISISI